MFKNALVSVSDKSGLAEFLKPYVSRGLRIVSTGGTATYLKDHGFKITDISEQTHFPEVMGGRVKTLHPLVHMPILARSKHPEDFDLLKSHGVEAFDLVICNLYPFEETLLKQKSSGENDFQALIEKIDIGGPTLLRASAKNFDRVTVVCDPKDYTWIAEKNSQQKELSYEDRKKLSAKVFAHTANYDSLVAQTLSPGFQDSFSVAGKKVQELRYGENPHQQAAWYALPGDSEGLHSAQILQGKALSYNNLLDLDASSALVREISEPCAVAVKHNNPCGVGMAADINLAIERAVQADPVSVFGGIIALNRELDVAGVQILEKIFLECIVAPAVSNEAQELLSKKKNLRVLIWPHLMKALSAYQVKKVSGGFLLQNEDSFNSQTEWQFLTERPNESILKDMVFGERVCAYLKSNAIAIVGEGRTLGLGMGQVNRVDAVEQAILRMKKFGSSVKDKVLVSDAFFPFPDSVERAAEAGIRWILQPGGSMKDNEVFQRAKELGIHMVISGRRHFRH